MIRRSLISLVFLHSASAWSDPAAELTETDYFSELPVVLSVARLSQPVSRAPAAVTVITREMIEASGFRQLPDLLRLVPGFQVSWVRGNLPTVTFQGLSSLYSRRLQVLVDGRSVYNPAYGHVQWRGIPLALDDIDRIEVVRGPNAANDGINAVQATVHIYTRPASADPGWTVAAAMGSDKIRDGLIRYAGATDDWQWRVTLNSRRDDWIDKHRDLARDHFFDARAEWRPNNRDAVTLQAGGLLGEWDNSSVGYTFSDQQTTDFANAYVQASWERTLNPANAWTLLANYTVTHADEAFKLASGFRPDNLDYWFSRAALEFSWQLMPAEQLRTVWTAEARFDRAWSATLVGPATLDGAIYRLSGGAEWSVDEAWVLHAGAMLEKHYYAGTRLSPRIAVNWLPAQGHSLRLGASRAYRSPTFLEQESDFKLTLGAKLYDQILLSPFKLKPETMDSAELGYLFHHAPTGINLDVRLFFNRLDDIIAFDEPFPIADELKGNGADLTYANLHRARQRGAEYQLRWQPGKATWLTLSQSWVRTRADLGELEQSAPAHNLSVLVSHDFGGLKGSLGYYRIDPMRWVGSQATPAYDRLDLRLSHAFKSGTTRGELSLIAQSVLGEYSEFGSGRVFEPKAYVTVKLGF